MIAMQLKPVPQKEMPPKNKGMDYGHEFQIMSGVVKLMVLEFPRLVYAITQPSYINTAPTPSNKAFVQTMKSPTRLGTTRTSALVKHTF